MKNKSFLPIIAFLLILSAAAVIAAGGGGGSIVIKKEPDPEPEPLAAEVTAEESALKCSTLRTINERVSCRINLERENELYYLPEECRAMVLGSDDREKCKNFYGSVQVCWTGENMADPVGCARSKLGLSSNVATDITSCNANSSCLNDITNKIHSLTKFRLYNLEWKAEYLVEEGVDVNHELLVDLVTNMELRKQEYNAAETIKEKKAVIREAQRIWQKFADRIRKQEGI